MAIFYMDVKIIGRSSGRSATGAAAYRRSAKMHSVAHAAYQRGEKIIGIGEKVTHDYRSKGGVVHSEIMLPDNAPPEFMDAQTLWNAVELSEKRKDAQLAREIIVALSREFNLQEQLEVLRRYIKDNFVSKGMIADFSVHDKGDDNPHAHIMLTTRNVSWDGFKEKNTDWNKKSVLYSWRESWADINNRMFERKGLSERIDHRTLRAQGLDLQPTIHLGAQAAALEKRGIKTERGAYNDKIRQQNQTRAALNAVRFRMMQEKYEAQRTAQHQEKSEGQYETDQIIQGVTDLDEHFKTGKKIAEKIYEQETAKTLETIIDAVKALERIIKKPNTDSANTSSVNTDDDVPNEVRTTLTTTKRMNQTQKNTVAPLRQSITPQAERIKKPDMLEMVKLREKLRKNQHTVEKELHTVKAELNNRQQERHYLLSQNEEIDEYKENLRAMREHLVQLRTERLDSHFWKLKRKRELSEQIELIEGEIRAARIYFEQKYHVKPEDAITEKRRITKQILKLETEIDKKGSRISQLSEWLKNLKQKARGVKHSMTAKRTKQRDSAMPEQYRMMSYRRNVMEHVKDLRRNVNRTKKNIARAKSIADIKPRLMRMIASAEREKQKFVERNQKTNKVGKSRG